MQSNDLRDYPNVWIVCISIRKANTRKPIELESEIDKLNSDAKTIKKNLIKSEGKDVNESRES